LHRPDRRPLHRDARGSGEGLPPQVRDPAEEMSAEATPGLLDAIELETANNPRASVIWLHGLGADGNDFAPIVPALQLPRAAIRFVFPHAPIQPVTINAGMSMRAWYDISDGALRREDENGVRASQRLVEGLIAREKTRGTTASRLVLAGFSQGGAIALQTGL